MKKKILAWSGWYPTRFQQQGIFIKKHLELIGNQHELTVFHISHLHHPYKWFFKETIIESFGNVNIYYIPNLFIIKHVSYLIIPILEFVKAKRIDVFHLHVSFPYLFFTLPLVFFSKKKFVLTEHWSGFTSGSGKYDRIHFLFKKIFEKGIRRYKAVSVVSLFLKNTILEKTGHSNIIVTPNLIDLQSYKSNFKKKERNYKWLSISNLKDDVKNIGFLLDVVYKFKHTNPNIILDIFGEGEDRAMLEKKAKELGILNVNVFFRGYIENNKIRTLYSQYDFFILLSRFETFSIVTFEAILNNLFVIVTKNGGVEDYITFKNGILVDINDLKATLQAVHFFYENFDTLNEKPLDKTLHKEIYRKEYILKQFNLLYK